MLKHVIFLTLLAASHFAAAWEVESGIQRPALRGLSPQAVKLIATKVKIADDFVEERYQLANLSRSNQNFLVWSTAGPGSRVGLLDDYPDQVFSEMSLGPKEIVRPESATQRAFFHGRDVTAELLRLGIDPARSLADDAYRRTWNRRVWQQLAKMGFIGGKDLDDFPRWVIVVSRSWIITLKAETQPWVILRYRARPSKELMSPGESRLRALVAGYCGEPLTTQSDSADLTFQVRRYQFLFGLGDLRPEQLTFSWSFEAKDKAAETIWRSSCADGLSGRAESAASAFSGVVRPINGSIDLLQIHIPR